MPAQYIEVVKEAGYDEVEPIMLTPKVLEKCGFRNFVREEWILSVGNTHIDFTFTEEGLKLRHPTPGSDADQILSSASKFPVFSHGV